LDVLQNICPNCGGGFYQRPIRPSKNLKNGHFLGHHPAAVKVTFKPKNLNEHEAFIKNIKNTPPHER
jgi:hypothetical protein